MWVRIYVSHNSGLTLMSAEVLSSLRLLVCFSARPVGGGAVKPVLSVFPRLKIEIGITAASFHKYKLLSQAQYNNYASMVLICVYGAYISSEDKYFRTLVITLFQRRSTCSIRPSEPWPRTLKPADLRMDYPSRTPCKRLRQAPLHHSWWHKNNQQI